MHFVFPFGLFVFLVCMEMSGVACAYVYGACDRSRAEFMEDASLKVLATGHLAYSGNSILT